MRPGAACQLAEQNRAVVTSILEDAAKNTSAPAGSDEQKIGAFYRACMNEAGIEKAGTGPIDPMLADVGRVASIPALVDEIGKLHVVGVNGGLNFGSGSDTKDSSKQIASLGMGGIGLPDRDYYLKDDARSQDIRKAYRTYVVAQLTNLGDAPATAETQADAIIALETALANATPTRIAMRDPAATYHPMPVADLDEARAAHSVVVVLRAIQRTVVQHGRRRDPGVRHRVRQLGRHHAAHDVEVVPALQDRRFVLELAAQALRRRELRVPQRRAERRQGTAPALAALHRAPPTLRCATCSARPTSRARSRPPPRRARSRSSTTSRACCTTTSRRSTG